MTDTTIDATTDKTTAADKETFTDSLRCLAQLVGFAVMILAVMYGIYCVGKDMFYDGAFNDGFEAGRASIATACANPDRGFAVARGCPL